MPPPLQVKSTWLNLAKCQVENKHIGEVWDDPNEPNWNRPLIACAERVNVDGFGLVYAERTQFRVVQAATLEGRRCRKPARR